VTAADVEGLLRELAPRDGPLDLPANPLGWLVTVANRRLVDEIARRAPAEAYAAAGRTANARERDHLTMRAASATQRAH
jgi:predicted RNA polymerase sigma factor